MESDFVTRKKNNRGLTKLFNREFLNRRKRNKRITFSSRERKQMSSERAERQQGLSNNQLWDASLGSSLTEYLNKQTQFGTVSNEDFSLNQKSQKKQQHGQFMELHQHSAFFMNPYSDNEEGIAFYHEEDFESNKRSQPISNRNQLKTIQPQIKQDYIDNVPDSARLANWCEDDMVISDEVFWDFTQEHDNRQPAIQFYDFESYKAEEQENKEINYHKNENKDIYIQNIPNKKQKIENHQMYKQIQENRCNEMIRNSKQMKENPQIYQQSYVNQYKKKIDNHQREDAHIQKMGNYQANQKNGRVFIDKLYFNLERKKACGLCGKENNFFYWNNVMVSRLYLKYASSQNYYYTRDVNDILLNNRSRVVINLKDEIVLDEEAEYFKRFYQIHEYSQKASLLMEYYKYHKDIPRLFMLPETYMLNSYHDNKRKHEYFRIAQLIEEENKLNPQRPPKGIVGEKPLRTNNSGSDEEHTNKDCRNSHDRDMLLENISSFINRGEYSEIQMNTQTIPDHTYQSYYNKMEFRNNVQTKIHIRKDDTKRKNNTKADESVTIQELNQKLEEIITNRSISRSIISVCHDEDPNQLDNFLLFLSKKEKMEQQQIQPSQLRNYQPQPQLKDPQFKNSAIVATTSLGKNNEAFRENLYQQIAQPSRNQNPQASQLQQNQIEKQKPPIEMGNEQSYVPSGLQNNANQPGNLNKLSQGQNKKQRQVINIKIDEINSDFKKGLSTTSHSVIALPQQLISPLNHNNQLSIRSPRDQQTLSSACNMKNGQTNKLSGTSTFGNSIKKPLGNQGTSSFSMVKLDTKESSMYTPRQMQISATTSCQKTLLNKCSQILINKPPLSPRDSTNQPYLIKQSQAEIQVSRRNVSDPQLKHLLISQSSPIDQQSALLKNKKNSNKLSSNRVKGTTSYTNSIPMNSAPSQIATANMVGWKQHGFKLKLDQVALGKDKPNINSNNQSNTNNIMNSNNNISNNNPSLIDPLSQRSNSNKNIDLQTPKYNFYEILKQQIGTTNQAYSSLLFNDQQPHIPKQQPLSAKNSSPASSMLNLIQSQQAQSKLFQSSSRSNKHLIEEGLTVKDQKDTKDVLKIQQPIQQQQYSSIQSPQVSVNGSAQFSRLGEAAQKLTVSINSNALKEQLGASGSFAKKQIESNSMWSGQQTSQSQATKKSGFSQIQNACISSPKSGIEQQKKMMQSQKTARSEAHTRQNSQPFQYSQHSQQNVQHIANSNQVKLSFEKSLSKQVSRNASIDINNNPNKCIKNKIPLLLSMDQKQSQNVFNLVNQLTKENPLKQSISARTHQPQRKTESETPKSIQIQITNPEQQQLGVQSNQIKQSLCSSALQQKFFQSNNANSSNAFYKNSNSQLNNNLFQSNNRNIQGGLHPEKNVNQPICTEKNINQLTCTDKNVNQPTCTDTNVNQPKCNKEMNALIHQNPSNGNETKSQTISTHTTSSAKINSPQTIKKTSNIHKHTKSDNLTHQLIDKNIQNSPGQFHVQNILDSANQINTFSKKTTKNQPPPQQVISISSFNSIINAGLSSHLHNITTSSQISPRISVLTNPTERQSSQRQQLHSQVEGSQSQQPGGILQINGGLQQQGITQSKQQQQGGQQGIQQFKQQYEEQIQKSGLMVKKKQVLASPLSSRSAQGNFQTEVFRSTNNSTSNNTNSQNNNNLNSGVNNNSSSMNSQQNNYNNNWQSQHQQIQLNNIQSNQNANNNNNSSNNTTQQVNSSLNNNYSNQPSSNMTSSSSLKKNSLIHSQINGLFALPSQKQPSSLSSISTSNVIPQNSLKSTYESTLSSKKKSIF